MKLIAGMDLFWIYTRPTLPLSIIIETFSEICVACTILYYMTNSYRPGLKKFDWFKADL